MANLVIFYPGSTAALAVLLLAVLLMGPRRAAALAVLSTISPLLLARGLGVLVVYLCDRATARLPRPYVWAAEVLAGEYESC